MEVHFKSFYQPKLLFQFRIILRDAKAIEENHSRSPDDCADLLPEAEEEQEDPLLLSIHQPFGFQAGLPQPQESNHFWGCFVAEDADGKKEHEHFWKKINRLNSSSWSHSHLPIYNVFSQWISSTNQNFQRTWVHIWLIQVGGALEEPTHPGTNHLTTSPCFQSTDVPERPKICRKIP